MNASSSRLVFVLALLSLLALVFSSGCASMRASSARTAYIHEMTEKHVYESDCERVWPTARNLLFSKGYAVKDTGEGTVMTLETEWRHDGTSDSRDNTIQSAPAASRYLVQGMQPDEEQCQVNFSMNHRSSNNSINSSRDLDLEWQLLQQVDPDAAAQISQEAEVRANVAAQG